MFKRVRLQYMFIGIKIERQLFFFFFTNKIRYIYRRLHLGESHFNSDGLTLGQYSLVISVPKRGALKFAQNGHRNTRARVRTTTVRGPESVIYARTAFSKKKKTPSPPSVCVSGGGGSSVCAGPTWARKLDLSKRRGDDDDNRRKRSIKNGWKNMVIVSVKINGVRTIVVRSES